MANGRNPRRKVDVGRDGGGFVALPWSVLDCPAFQALSHPARSLLLEVARQFARDNNGRLLLSRAYMVGRGWKSHDTLTRATSELLRAGFLFETVKGCRPNKASWYAITWRALDQYPGYDAGATGGFIRGAYRIGLSGGPDKNAPLSPSGGLERRTIGPSGGPGASIVGPSAGPIEATFAPASSPSYGHHLEKPSEVNAASAVPAFNEPALDVKGARQRAARTARTTLAAPASIQNAQPVPTKPPPKNATDAKQPDAGARHRVVNKGGRLAKDIDGLSGSPGEPATVLPGQLGLFDSELPCLRCAPP